MKDIFRFLRVVHCLLLTENQTYAQWTQSGISGMSIDCFAVSGSNIFAGMRNGIYISGVFLSTNYGASWTEVKRFSNSRISSLAVSPASGKTGGENIFAGIVQTFTGGQEGVFLTTKNGASWTAVNNGLPDPISILSLAVSPASGETDGANLFVGVPWLGVYRSTNNGTSWTAANTGLTDKDYICAFAVTPASGGTGGTNLFAGSSSSGVFLSTNNGTSWTHAGLTDRSVNALAVSGSNLFAGGIDGVFLSTDNGAHWTQTALVTYIFALAVSDTNLFAATNGEGVYVTTDNGANWNTFNTGLTSLSVWSLGVSGGYFFAGTGGGGVWRHQVGKLIPPVEPPPTHFSLYQNYPNPFNSGTTISFDLPTKSFVSLKVFDALGKGVSELVEDELTAGTYARQWSSAGFPSGAYFYRMEAGSFTETKKLLLIK